MTGMRCNCLKRPLGGTAQSNPPRRQGISASLRRKSWHSTVSVQHSAARHRRYHRHNLLVTATVDRTIEVKIGLVPMTGKLDLSECSLSEIPPAVFDLQDLTELTLAGNQLTELPADISRLSNLERLQIAGNLLHRLPDELGRLQSLQGLWVHGNLLQTLPNSVGDLVNLRVLSAAGNRISALPKSIGGLQSVEDLGFSGNLLTAIPDTVGDLSKLRKLTFNGNQLQQLPAALGKLTSLKELWVQCNQLQEVPHTLGQLMALEQLSLADNRLTALPTSLEQLASLKDISLYGNQLKGVPPQLLALPALQHLWLEGNTFDEHGLDVLQDGLTANTSLRNLGLDTVQVEGMAEEVVQQLKRLLRVGEVIGSGPGYFKLAPGHQSTIGSSNGNGSSSDKRVLVVAFGSAPGVPNWGGLLKKVYKAATEDRQRCFDVLYVVDGARAWYEGGDDGWEMYRERLQLVTTRYEHVMLLGDSMGATAALMFSPLATAVTAFCPQVDLTKSSIRPGEDPAWQARLKDRVHESVAQSSACIQVYTGNWLHDVDQVRDLPEDHVTVKVFSDVDTHRLAIYLDRQGQLVPIIRTCIMREMGYDVETKVKPKIRLANLL